jgi:hypothetical protein
MIQTSSKVITRPTHTHRAAAFGDKLFFAEVTPRSVPDNQLKT